MVFLFVFAGPVSAQPTNKIAASDQVGIPDNLRYLFDFPWCTKWDLGCFHCEKKAGKITCERQSNDCSHYTPGYFACIGFDVEKSCQSWTYDGCNVCTRGWPTSDSTHCTAMYCGSNRPKFTCLRRSF